MSPFNPTNAQFYYDTASRLERAVQSNSEQMLKYEAEIAALRSALEAMAYLSKNRTTTRQMLRDELAAALAKEATT